MKTKMDFRKFNFKNLIKACLLILGIVFLVYFLSPFFNYIDSSYIDSSFVVGKIYYSNDRGDKYEFIDSDTVKVNKNFDDTLNYFYSFSLEEGTLKISDNSTFYFLNENMIWNYYEHYFLIRY